MSASGVEQWNRVTTTTGYASSSDRTVFFGFGREESVRWIEIAWPSGLRQRIDNPKIDRYLSVGEP
jgi:hypothetical protein